MKKLYLLLILSSAALPALAQENTDTTSSTRTLDELVVQGRTQRVIKNGVEYIPEKKLKKAATDATSLLMHMNIPQLNISPGTAEIKTFTGKSVALFIDFMPASEEELKGLRPEDVVRVEILEYPDDPRFNSQPNVVNFIMRQYEWGGYTKLTASGTTLNTDRLYGTVYSKFAYKNWTFDASAGGSIDHNDRFSSYSRETFRDFYIGERHFDELTRTSHSGDGYLLKDNNQWASLRTVYNNNFASISHTLSFNRSANPLTRDNSDVSFSDPILPSSEAKSYMSGQSISPYIRGYYYFKLPKANSLSASWSFGYGSSRRNSEYRLADLAPVINNNREKVYSPTANLTYSKKFSHGNTFRTALMTFNTVYDTEYAGSYEGRQKMLSSENMLFIEYMQNWKNGLNLYSRVGMSYVVGRLNGTTTLEQWNPRLGLQLSYKINDRHSASIEGWWGNSHPQPSATNSALVQSNELLWLQGNPDIRNTIFASAKASYTFIPSNRFSLTASASYEGNPNKQSYEFRIIPGYNGLVRRIINSGDFHQYSAWLSATLKLFRNSLSIKGNLQAERIVLTGIDRQSANHLFASIYANYYIRNFSFMAFYQSPQKTLDAWGHGFRANYKSTYGIYATYYVGELNVSLQFRNWFNRNRYYEDYASQHYSVHSWRYSNDLARTISLTVTYTFPYGKELWRGNELDKSGSTGSAILK